MPTIPLYDSPADPNAWHRVRSPGGYEWWHFDTVTDDGGTGVSAFLFAAMPHHVQMLAKYRRYARRPTQNEPPRPADYAQATVRLYRDSVALSTHHRVAPFEPAATGIGGNIGEDSFSIAHDGTITLSIGDRSKFAVELQFTSPQIPAIEFELFSGHHWVLPTPRCEVRGTIWTAQNASPFIATGYLDHYWGLRPPAVDIDQWLGGRVMLDDTVLLFHMLSLKGPQHEGVMRLVKLTATGLEEQPVRSAGVAEAPAWPWRRFLPTSVSIGDLQLVSPRLISSEGNIREFSYDAKYQGHTGRAFVTLFEPNV